MFFFIGRRLVILAALAMTALPAMAARSAAAEPVMIFAAATLKNALDAVDAAAEASTHVRVTAVYAPSPSLVKQLENGAPGDIFFSADVDWMNEAIARKVVDPSTRDDLLSSKLVLVAPEPRRRSALPEQVVNVNVVPDERMLLTVVEAARRLAIGRSSMYRLLEAGQIRSIHVGRSHRIPVDALVEFVNKQQPTP